MEKEIRVYVLDCAKDENGFDFRGLEHMGEDDKIMAEAEARGSVYSLPYFQECINNEELNLSNSFILIK